MALQRPEGRCSLFLKQTAVTRVNPPEARGALTFLPVHEQVSRFGSVLGASGPVLTQTSGEAVHFPAERRESELKACGRRSAHRGPPSGVFRRGGGEPERVQAPPRCAPWPAVTEAEDPPLSCGLEGRAGRRGEKQEEPRSRDAAARFRLAAVAGEEPKGAEDSRA